MDIWTLKTLVVLTNNAGSGKNGDILFTTKGHSSGDTYSITLEMVKVYSD